MISKVVFAPQPLFLLPEYRGRVEVAPELRAAAVEAVRGLSGAERLLVVTGAAGGPAGGAAGGAGGGSAGSSGGGRRLPAGLRVAYELLAEAGVADLPGDVVVPFDRPTPECLEQGRALAGDDVPTALLVMADGSARRGEKAPGHVDERAFVYDRAFVAALEQGAPDQLAALDADLARALLFSGRAALQVAAGAVGELTPSSIVHSAGDPFGVMYVVAAWTLP